MTCEKVLALNSSSIDTRRDELVFGTEKEECVQK